MLDLIAIHSIFDRESQMAARFSSSLFLSEALIIISSCVFVVMALLTAVISVTNIALWDDHSCPDCYERNCYLPHRFVVSPSYDIPRSLENSTSPFGAFIGLLQSSLRCFMITNRFIDSSAFTNPSYEPIHKAFEDQLKGRSADSVPGPHLPFLLPHSSHLRLTEPLVKFNYELENRSLAYDVDRIKRLLHGGEHPLLAFLNVSAGAVSRQGVLNIFPTTNSFLIYGWNNDFAGGGFIVRFFGNETVGHSIPFFLGLLTNDEERAV
jgi:hypothetical protein